MRDKRNIAILVNSQLYIGNRQGPGGQFEVKDPGTGESIAQFADV